VQLRFRQLKDHMVARAINILVNKIEKGAASVESAILPAEFANCKSASRIGG